MLVLRHQLAVSVGSDEADRGFVAATASSGVRLYRVWPRCLKVMVLVKPATVIRWHRQRLPQILALGLKIAARRAAGSEWRDS